MSKFQWIPMGLLACCQMLPGAGDSATANEFQPHRAVYDLSLKSVEDSSGISGLTGKMVYEVRGSACEGYTVEFRLLTDVSATNGTSRLTDVRTTSYETGDASEYQFMTRTYQDQKLAQESRGSAIRDGESVRVALKNPAEKDFALGGGVLFPSQHFFEVIRLAKAGENFFSADVYDGSEEGETYFETAAVIGKPRELTVADGEPASRDTQYWPVTISYYDPRKGQTDAMPIYTLRFMTNAPGISRELEMDYNAFVIDGKLADLTYFPVQSCE